MRTSERGHCVGLTTYGNRPMMGLKNVFLCTWDSAGGKWHNTKHVWFTRCSFQRIFVEIIVRMSKGNPTTTISKLNTLKIFMMCSQHVSDSGDPHIMHHAETEAPDRLQRFLKIVGLGGRDGGGVHPEAVQKQTANLTCALADKISTLMRNLNVAQNAWRIQD